VAEVIAGIDQANAKELRPDPVRGGTREEWVRFAVTHAAKALRGSASAFSRARSHQVSGAGLGRGVADLDGLSAKQFIERQGCLLRSRGETEAKNAAVSRTAAASIYRTDGCGTVRIRS